MFIIYLGYVLRAMFVSNLIVSLMLMQPDMQITNDLRAFTKRLFFDRNPIYIKDIIFAILLVSLATVYFVLAILEELLENTNWNNKFLTIRKILNTQVRPRTKKL